MSWNMQHLRVKSMLRAVDHMRVVLRKRLLTEAEKQQVQVYLKRPDRRNSVVSRDNESRPASPPSVSSPVQV